jgi:hypothetical protein
LKDRCRSFVEAETKRGFFALKVRGRHGKSDFWPMRHGENLRFVFSCAEHDIEEIHFTGSHVRVVFSDGVPHQLRPVYVTVQGILHQACDDPLADAVIDKKAIIK